MLGLERGQGINHKEKRDLPAKTADEWLKREGLITWPVPIASEGELDLSEIEERLESREGLLKDLQNHACIFLSIFENTKKLTGNAHQKLHWLFLGTDFWMGIIPSFYAN